MKKTILMLAVSSLAALALSSNVQAAESTDWNYYWDKNAQAMTPTPYKSPSDTSLGRSVYFSIEGAHSFASDKQTADLNGMLFSLNFYSNANESRTHQFFVQSGVLNGKKTNWLDNNMDFDKNSYNNVPLLVGYHYNYALTNRLFLYGGAKAGFTFVDKKITTATTTHRDSDVSPTVGVGAGLKFAITPRVDAIFGYDFYRDFTNVGDKSDFQNYHMLHLGVSFGF